MKVEEPKLQSQDAQCQQWWIRSLVIMVNVKCKVKHLHHLHKRLKLK